MNELYVEHVLSSFFVTICYMSMKCKCLNEGLHFTFSYELSCIEITLSV